MITFVCKISITNKVACPSKSRYLYLNSVAIKFINTFIYWQKHVRGIFPIKPDINDELLNLLYELFVIASRLRIFNEKYSIILTIKCYNYLL